MSNDYHRTTVSGIVTWSDTSDAQMKRYEQGLVVVGKNYANDVLDIDLSGYPAAHGKHKVKLNDGTYGESSCPTGKLNLVVVNAQVVVTLPDGCQWSVSDPDDGYTNVTDYIGRPDGITFFNGTGFMGLSLDENDDSGLGHHGVNKGVPALNGTTDFDDSGDDDAAMPVRIRRTIRRIRYTPARISTRHSKRSTRTSGIGRRSIRTRLRRNRICMSTSMERSAAVSPCSTRPTASCQWERRSANRMAGVDGKNVGKSASGKETK